MMRRLRKKKTIGDLSCPGHSKAERGQGEAVRGPQAEGRLPAQSRGQGTQRRRWRHGNFSCIGQWHGLHVASACSLHDRPADLLGLLVCAAQLAAVAALCVQYEADFRPNMTIVVKALQPLVNARPAGAGDHQ